MPIEVIVVGEGYMGLHSGEAAVGGWAVLEKRIVNDVNMWFKIDVA